MHTTLSSFTSVTGGPVRITASNFKIARLKNEISVLKAKNVELPVNEAETYSQMNYQN